MITTVTGKNQVTIPAVLASKHGIEPGSRLDWREGRSKNELRVVVKPGPVELLRRIREIGARYAVTAKDSERILAEFREEEDSTLAEKEDRNEGDRQ